MRPSTLTPADSGRFERDGYLKTAKRDPLQAKILTERVRGVFDDPLGRSAWIPPKDWGRTIATFPEPGEWDVPTPGSRRSPARRPRPPTA